MIDTDYIAENKIQSPLHVPFTKSASPNSQNLRKISALEDELARLREQISVLVVKTDSAPVIGNYLKYANSIYSTTYKLCNGNDLIILQ